MKNTRDDKLARHLEHQILHREYLEFCRDEKMEGRETDSYVVWLTVMVDNIGRSRND